MKRKPTEIIRSQRVFQKISEKMEALNFLFKSKVMRTVTWVGEPREKRRQVPRRSPPQCRWE
jgi:hypothetical protein